MGWNSKITEQKYETVDVADFRVGDHVVRNVPLSQDNMESWDVTLVKNDKGEWGWQDRNSWNPQAVYVDRRINTPGNKFIVTLPRPEAPVNEFGPVSP